MLSGLLPTKMEKRSWAQEGVPAVKATHSAAISKGLMVRKLSIKNINLQYSGGLLPTAVTELNFSAPTGPDASGGELFNLTIKNPINPAGDSIYGFELTDLGNLGNSFSLSGITVSNFRYQVVDGAGAGTSFLGTSRGNTFWYNDESNHASLYILADFTAPVMTPVPEPEIYAMLGAGLGLVGWVARRRKQHNI
jgi:hypothetical protein